MARVIRLPATILLTACLLLAGCDLFTSSHERVARAEQLIASGAYSEALVELNVALEKSPNDPRAQLALARVSLQLGSTDAASHALDVATKANADPAQVAELRAGVALLQAKNDEVLAATDPATSKIASPARETLRLRALVALHRFPEVIALARTLEDKNATTEIATVSLAESFARLGNAAGARTLLDAAVKSHPDAAEAWLARGRLLQIDGKVSAAEESYASALRTAGGQLTLMQQLNAAAALADLQLMRGDVAAARATHQQMLKLAPDAALAGVLGARLLLAEGKTAEAVAAIQELVAKSGEVDELRVPLASAQLANGTLQQASSQVSALAQKNPSAAALKLASDVLARLPNMKPDTAEYWLSAAGVQISLGQPHMARLALRRAAELSPDSPAPPAALGELELRSGNTAECLRIVNAILAKRPQDAAALALLAEAERADGQYAQAAAALERLWAQAPTAGTALALARARDEAKLGNGPGALAAWLAGHPDDVLVRGAYADSLRQAGDNARAIAEFEAVLAKAPNVVPALNNLAWLYYLEKDPRAVPTARRAWQGAPHSRSVADTYGWLLVESGAVQEGLNVLEAAWNDGGLVDPELRYHYAAALARSGQAARAAEQLRVLLSEVPEFPSRDAAQKLAATIK